MEVRLTVYSVHVYKDDKFCAKYGRVSLERAQELVKECEEQGYQAYFTSKTYSIPMSDLA